MKNYKLYKKFTKTQDTFWYTRYIKSYLRENFQKHAKNSKETWNKINQILNNKKLGFDNIYLSENGMIIPDPKHVANQFNNYFVVVPEKLAKKC